MSANLKEYKYALRLPMEDKVKVGKVAKASGQSINSVVVLCIEKGLPEVKRMLCPDKDRLVTVAPLPDDVWERIYAREDKDTDGIKAMMALQSEVKP